MHITDTLSAKSFCSNTIKSNHSTIWKLITAREIIVTNSSCYSFLNIFLNVNVSCAREIVLIIVANISVFQLFTPGGVLTGCEY